MKIYTTAKNKKIFSQILIFVFWIGFWQCAAMLIDKPLLLPSPIETLQALIRLAGKRDFYLNIGFTFMRCIISMALAFGLGMIFSWCAYKNKLIRGFLNFPVGFFKAVPVMAIIIYVILLAPADSVAVIVCFFMCFPVVYTNILEGFDSLDNQLLELAKIYEFTGMNRFRYIYIPGVMVQIKAAIKLIAGLSWKAVVAAEVLSIPKYSLGYQMMNAKYYLETDVLFAYIFVIVTFSLAVEKAIKTVINRWDFRAYDYSKIVKGLKSNPGYESKVPCEVNIRHLSKDFDGKGVLDDVNIQFKKGEVTAIVGPSGQGKTTLVRIIAGLEKQKSGMVEKGPMRTSYLFQEDRLIPWLNVFDNIAFGIVSMEDDIEKKVVSIADMLEISDVLWKLPGELSGGMRHRVALGRTFICESSLLILDEPFRGLDEDLKGRIIKRLWKRVTCDKTVLLITHNRNDADRLSDRVIEYEDFRAQN